MTKKARLTIVDEVNVCLTGVTDNVHTALTKHYRKFEPTAVFSPQYKMKKWDGYYLFYKNGWFYINLVDEDFFNIVAAYGYQIELVDNRKPWKRNFEEIGIDYFSHLNNRAGEPFMLRDYQAHSINLATTNSNGIFELATGAGKSYVCAGIASLYQQMGKVITIVPSIDLVVQTAKSFRELGIERVGEFYGLEKIVENVTLSTWQSLINYPEILEGVVCIIADECQEYKAKEVHNLLTDAAKNVPYRFGFTGTVPKKDIDKTRLTASIGPILFTKEAWELQNEGILATCHINILQYQEDQDINDELEEFSDEYNYIIKNPKRRQHIAEKIIEISKTGNTLVLIKNIKAGDALAKLLPGVKFMYGKAKGTERLEEYNNLHEGDNGILICTEGIAARGIDIPRIFNLVMIDPRKDFIKIIQSIGRGLRKFSDKSHVEIWDICSNLEFSSKHLKQRKKMYTKAKYPYSETPVFY